MAAPTNEGMDRSSKYADDWFFASVKLYDQLHMFDLQNPATAVCWMSDERVCVVGSKLPGKSEILELSLPSRLLAAEEGLEKDRDFDVLSGIYHNELISSVHRVSDTCIVTTENGDNLIRTWVLGGNTKGTILQTQMIRHPLPENLPARVALPPDNGSRQCVLFGSTVSNLCLVDLDTEKPIYKTTGASTDQMCGLEFMDDNTFLACSSISGDIWCGDIRECQSKVRHHTWTGDLDSSGGQWTSDFLPTNPGGRQGIVVRMSNKGHMFVSDVSYPGQWIKRANSSRPPGKHLQIRNCPHNLDRISTTDSTGNVLIYHTDRWSQSGGPTSEHFRHEGHWVNSETDVTEVRAHMWHPSRSELVLSVACDGSLHVWSPSPPNE